jgi:hypothetical protein
VAAAHHSRLYLSCSGTTHHAYLERALQHDQLLPQVAAVCADALGTRSDQRSVHVAIHLWCARCCISLPPLAATLCCHGRGRCRRQLLLCGLGLLEHGKRLRGVTHCRTHCAGSGKGTLGQTAL